jgi:hypothetical protein
LCKWNSPIILAFAYSRGYLNLESLIVFARIAFIFSGCLLTAYMSRAIGRYSNQDYSFFISRYYQAKKNENERKEFLSAFDFELKYWQPSFIPSTKPPVL